jgi:hypothetical protein
VGEEAIAVSVMLVAIELVVVLVAVVAAAAVGGRNEVTGSPHKTLERHQLVGKYQGALASIGWDPMV